ncbi:sodium:solute symporter [Streptomyces sp. NPDC001904]|uniref:sodium:solute symporter family protein n=1 Tax=Streptomyces sp. NPDC001904 TaxID=3154531 RepID=UPI003330FEF9
MAEGVINQGTVAAFAGLICCAVAFGARRPPRDELPDPTRWALGERSLGTAATCLLLGGTIYTSYTYIAVPGLMFGAGEVALYALAYVTLLVPLIMVLFPRIRDVAARQGVITTTDYVQVRHGSHALGLATTFTGILATMPYLGLQVVGLADVLQAMGFASRGTVGLLALAVLFILFAVVAHPGGLRACVRLSLVKAVLIGAAAVVLLILTWTRLGSPGHVFALAAGRSADTRQMLTRPPSSFTGYITLAVGSALAQLVYPQVFTVALVARSRRTLRAATAFLPAWNLSLGLWAFFGVAALAAGVHASSGYGGVAVPELINAVAPPWLAGLLYGALAVAGLLPAVLMAMGMALLFVRNVYVEYLNPTATPKHEVRSTRWPALAIMAGAVVFAVLLKPQETVNLHLLGCVWILQTLPAVVVSMFTRWFHHRALLAGWAVGMLTGTWLLVGRDGFSTVLHVAIGPLHASVYVAVAALALNLGAAAVLTPFLDRLGVERGKGGTADGTPRQRRGSKYTFVVD